MKNLRIIFIALLPPVITGQSIMSQVFLDFLIKKKANIKVIRLSPYLDTNTGITLVKKTYNYLFFFSTLFFLVIFWKKIIYLPGARTKSGLYRNMLIILWGTIFKHKLIVHFHCGTYADFVEKLSPTLKRMNIWCYKKVDNIVILSNKTKKSFELTKNISSKISVIPYGIKINENITNLKEKFLTKSDPIKIIYLSNLIESKGYFDVLKAVDILVNIKKINICCSFYGLFMNSPDDSNGKSIEDYKSLFFGFIKNKNLQNHVFYKGVIHNELKYLTIVNSHFFVLPSNYSTEGLPVSIIEAMAYKSLVISTDHNAITDLIIPDITGYLVPFSKPEEIANKIEFCTKHPYKYDEIISNAYKHVSENFREQKYCEQLLALFH